jgi:mannose-6-phosphate isomerase-like protein (cupin superfamily)
MSTPTILPPGEGETLQVGGDTIRILVDSARTDGTCTVFESASPPRVGPPLHRHLAEDEHFYVIEGTAKFVVDGKEILLSAGGSAWAPRGSVHTYTNAGEGVLRMIVTCTPGGIEIPFRKADRMMREAAIDLQAFGAMFKQHKIEMMGPPLFPPG